MTKRYAAALEQIRTLLASRTQADPLLDARDVWEELTCYPVPSLRTVRRLMETLRLDAEIGRGGQPEAKGRRGQTGASGSRRLYRMTNSEITAALDELQRRADIFERRSVELDADTIALLDAAARREGTTRHFIAAMPLRKFVAARYPDLVHPSMLGQSGTDSPKH